MTANCLRNWDNGPISPRSSLLVLVSIHFPPLYPKLTVLLQAYTFGCEDPWQAAQYIPHHLVAYFIPNTQTSYPHESKWSISVTIHISEPELEARLLGLVREKNKISDSTQALSEFPCSKHLSSSLYAEPTHPYLFGSDRVGF